MLTLRGLFVLITASATKNVLSHPRKFSEEALEAKSSESLLKERRSKLQDKSFDACNAARKPCENGGECVSKDGNFYCICPTTHFGKTCEHIADQTNCAQHLCQNNATCTSTRERRRVVNTPKLAEIRAMRGNDSLSDDELQQINVVVAYQCICRPAFFGIFCDIAEALKTCEEDYCMNRGRGLLRNGTCTCQCDQQYFGERCEQVSACFNYDCENGATCSDKVDLQAKTITASCGCAQEVQLIGSKTSGERCEKFDAPPGTPPKFLPCSADMTSFNFITELIAEIGRKHTGDSTYAQNIKELEEFRDNYHPLGSDDMSVGMTKGWCENDAKCVPEVVKLSHSRFYYLHRCECKSLLEEGTFCEYKRGSACDLTRDERRRGLTVEGRCTNQTHGHCVDLLGFAKCSCRSDYTGESCENFDPCARKPCKHGDCVPVTDQVEMVDERGGQQAYQCLCPIGSQLEDEKRCVKVLDGNCTLRSCRHGRCVACQQVSGSGAEADPFNMCNQREQRQGFRCLCEAGWSPPNCRHSTDACYQNMCEHASHCVPKEHSYDCVCVNGTSGSLCESIDDACMAFGELACEHGECVNDDYYRRGYACQCRFGWSGMNCEVRLNVLNAVYSALVKRYSIVVPLIVCILSLLVLLSVLLSKKPRPPKVI